MKTINRLFLTALAFLSLSPVAPKAQAVNPPPDGGYPGGNTAEGQNALLSLTSGTYNTAVGFLSLRDNTEGNFNTAIGAGALLFNVGGELTGHQNTATGAGALLNNINGNRNTANGEAALFFNITGLNNTAIGTSALQSNTRGSGNTASGDSALLSNTTGLSNTASGHSALKSNTTGGANTATGERALLSNTTGNANTALGGRAGINLTTGSGNVCIGDGVFGVAGESNTTRIRNIYASIASDRQVYVNSDDKLGTLASSRRFKEQINPMDKASDAILALKPVTFRYKKEIDAHGAKQFGLIAEEVEKVNPDLVTRDEEGKPQTVRYDAVNAMLLNEFLKEHRKVQRLEAALEAMSARLKQQDAKIERVSEQVELSKPAVRMASND
jgi:Chaperone of endosialidase